MPEANDMDLVREFASQNSEKAFAELVRRHLNFVYSVAMRFTGREADAQDVTQAVFIILAKRAASLRERTVLTGWLYETTRFTAGRFLRTQYRRQAREQEVYMESATVEPHSDDIWQQLAPYLEEAMSRLSERERTLLALRFYENKTGAEAAVALGMREEAAQKSTARALEKLRKIFSRRGLALSAAAIGGALAANSVQAAPAGLVETIGSVVSGGELVSPALTTLVKGTMNAAAWAKIKLAAGLGATALVIGMVAWKNWNAYPTSKPVGPTGTPAVGERHITRPKPILIREPFSTATSFSLDTPVGGVAIQNDGKIVIGSTLFGFFVDTNTGSLGAWARGALRLNPDGSLDRTFLCDVGKHDSAADMAHISLGAQGEMLLSGLFDLVEGEPRPGYARLRADGSLDETFIPWRGSNSVPGRTYLPGGTFPAALLADGTVAILSRSVEGGRAGDELTAYRLDATGKWLQPTNRIVGKTFGRPSGLVHTLSGNGFSVRRSVDWTNTAAATLRPPIRYGSAIIDVADSPAVQDIPFDRWTQSPSAAEAAVVLTSLYEEIPEALCRYLLRLPDGGAVLAVRDGPPMGPSRLMQFDRDWRPNFSFTNEFQSHPAGRLTLCRQPDGKILVAGVVGTMDGEEFSGVMRLEVDGAVDHGFHCEIANTIDSRVEGMALQADGRIVICGFFGEVNGVEVPHVARLNPDGSLDQSFRPAFKMVAQFNRERFGKKQRVPVASLSDTNVATPGVNIAPATATILITSFGVDGGVAKIQFSGAANQNYILQSREAFAETAWTSLITNRADATGKGQFLDGDAGNHPTRFYRIATP